VRSDRLLGADRLADGPDDLGTDWADWEAPPPRSNGEFHARATRKPKFQLVAYDDIVFALKSGG
jgi:hypothetical protein